MTIGVPVVHRSTQSPQNTHSLRPRPRSPNTQSRLDKLKWRLIDVRCGLEQSILTRILTSGEEDFEHMSMLQETENNL